MALWTANCQPKVTQDHQNSSSYDVVKIMLKLSVTVRSIRFYNLSVWPNNFFKRSCTAMSCKLLFKRIIGETKKARTLNTASLSKLKIVLFSNFDNCIRQLTCLKSFKQMWNATRNEPDCGRGALFATLVETVFDLLITPASTSSLRRLRYFDTSFPLEISLPGTCCGAM